MCNTYISVNVSFHVAAQVCENRLASSGSREVNDKFDCKEIRIKIKKKQNQGMLNKLAVCIHSSQKEKCQWDSLCHLFKEGSVETT